MNWSNELIGTYSRNKTIRRETVPTRLPSGCMLGRVTFAARLVPRYNHANLITRRYTIGRQLLQVYNRLYPFRKSRQQCSFTELLHRHLHWGTRPSSRLFDHLALKFLRGILLYAMVIFHVAEVDLKDQVFIKHKGAFKEMGSVLSESKEDPIRVDGEINQPPAGKMWIA